jgi:hypothetical protein
MMEIGRSMMQPSAPPTVASPNTPDRTAALALAATFFSHFARARGATDRLQTDPFDATDGDCRSVHSATAVEYLTRRQLISSFIVKSEK